VGGAKKQSNDDDSLIICASDKIRSDQIRFQGWLLALAVGLARPTCAGRGSLLLWHTQSLALSPIACLILWLLGDFRITLSI